MLLRKKKGIVGLDIGSSAVKLVELKGGKGGSYSLLHAAHAPLSPEAIVEGTVMDSSLVVEVAQRLIQEQSIKNPNFGISLSGLSVAIRKIQVPAMSDAELAESIHWEAEQYLPFDVNEVNLDYVVLSSDADTMDVLLVAAKKDRIADYTGIVTQLGKLPSLVDVDVFALQNAFETNYTPGDGTVGLVNIGGDVTNINIIQGSSPHFTRDISVGTRIFIENLQKQMGIGYEDAQKVISGDMEGTSGLMAPSGLLLDLVLLRLDRLRLLEVDVAGDVENAEQDGHGALGAGEEPDLGLLPGRVVADAGQVLAVDAEVAGQRDDGARPAGRDGLAADGRPEGVAEVLRVALEIVDGVEVDVRQRLGTDVLDPEGDLGHEDEPGRPGLVVLGHPGGGVVQDLEGALQLLAGHALAGRQGGQRQAEDDDGQDVSLHAAPPLYLSYDNGRGAIKQQSLSGPGARRGRPRGCRSRAGRRST